MRLDQLLILKCVAHPAVRFCPGKGVSTAADSGESGINRCQTVPAHPPAVLFWGEVEFLFKRRFKTAAVLIAHCVGDAFNTHFRVCEQFLRLAEPHGVDEPGKTLSRLLKKIIGQVTGGVMKVIREFGEGYRCIVLLHIRQHFFNVQSAGGRLFLFLLSFSFSGELDEQAAEQVEHDLFGTGSFLGVLPEQVEQIQLGQFSLLNAQTEQGRDFASMLCVEKVLKEDIFRLEQTAQRG